MQTRSDWERDAIAEVQSAVRGGRTPPIWQVQIFVDVLKREGRLTPELAAGAHQYGIRVTADQENSHE